ncbi:uncharacterized protein LOC120084553 [Benincasa hispida]|uniref:uncharacterized protein LOC120084553 n=1 Tax=Benincasa hispida TaxID=102211 RepID=UPI0018FFE5EC|nr:uncharacterized protein LOC120084553 [Benincasa hispida]
MIVLAEKYFPATVACQVHKIAPVIKKKLTEEQMRLYKETTFDPLLDIYLVFNGQLLHHFLSREVVDANPDIISFNIIRKKVTFSYEDFNLITGLWPTKETVERETSGERVRELILGPKNPNRKDSSCKDVEIAFENFNFTNDQDAVKVALTLFIETMMIGKDKKTQFVSNIFGIFDDHDVFVHYDWSSLFYGRTLNSMKTIMRGKNEAYDSKKAKGDHYASHYCTK